jgi:hypothetical protein
MLVGLVILVRTKRDAGDPQIVLVMALSMMAYCVSSLIEGKFGEHAQFRFEGTTARIVASCVLAISVLALIWAIRHWA